MKDIGSIKEEYDLLLNKLSDPELISDWEKFEELSKEKKKLETIISKHDLISEIEKKIEESKVILKSEQDAELIALAESDIAELQERLQNLKKELTEIISESPKTKSGSVIVEIRAGTGGDEAAIFAADLFRMYSRYAEIKNWKLSILDSHSISIGGYKEIIFEIKDKDAYSRMKYEGGVHRVQRIPKTEKSGRIHTSTASVAILLKPKKTDLKIKSDELRIDIAKASGPGGQNVNKRMTAVRITHLPTGIMVKSSAERSLPQNKENAMSILSAKLMEKKEREENSKIGKARNVQIGNAERVEKIRTYNFPQDRITDHRIKKSWRGLEDIMDGNVDKMIDTLEKELKEE